MAKPKIGLLALYIQLYDDTEPKARPRMDAFYDCVRDALADKGLDVVTAPVCRVEKEFRDAIVRFESSQVDLLVTLHLAYSPSLEAIDALCDTKLPLLVLDTTDAYYFGPLQESGMTMYNHGIHGVQDLCNLLVRHKRPFQIEVGHWKHSDVLDRVINWAKAAHLLKSLHSTRIGRLGGSFDGMGDFTVSEDELKETLGVDTVICDPAVLKAFAKHVSQDDIKAEAELDHKRYCFDGLSDEVYEAELRSGLALRAWAESEALTGLTVNFMAADSASGLLTMPFLEACKAMERGLGYAGEGDVLTAALTSALNASFESVSFTEMFSPDWEGGSVLVSHMGEMNLSLAAETPVLTEMPFVYTDAGKAVKPCARFMAGEVCLVNLSPIDRGRFRLILSPGQMLDVEGEDRFSCRIHGWFKPDAPLAEFLAAFSRSGGIHHSALVYGHVLQTMICFGMLAGCETVVIGQV